MREFTGGNPDIERELLTDFVQTIPAKLVEANYKFEEGNFEEMGKIVHYMKSSFGVLGVDIQFLKEYEENLKQPNIDKEMIESKLYNLNICSFDLIEEILTLNQQYEKDPIN